MAVYEWHQHSGTLNSDADYKFGNRINNVPTITITDMRFYVKKVGSPTGSCSARIRDAGQGYTVLKTMGSALDISTISTSYGWITFSDSYTIPSLSDYRFTLDFTSQTGDFPTNYIDVRQYTPHTLGSDFKKTTSLTESSGWSDAAADGYIVTFIITYTYSTTLPTVTTQACANTIAEKSTAWGNLVSIGGSAVTQHGHCWATSTEPTTSDSKTELGAAPNLGQFSSSMTSLTPSTKYYVRSYATNTSGTAYGNEVDTTSTGTIGNRELWSQYTSLRYVDQYGTVRKVEGTTVTGAHPYPGLISLWRG